MNTTEIQLPEGDLLYKGYIGLLGEVDLMGMLERQLQNFPKFIEAVPDDKWHYAYAPGKWTVGQVFLHIIDAERVFQYRALRFSRGDSTELPGFDQDLYAMGYRTENMTKECILGQYRAVRNTTISLFGNLDRDTFALGGIAGGIPWNVGVLGFAICGHQKHHRNGIRDRYL
ncbi:MAG: DinB family protein [Bacteroidota bacterium]